MLTEWFIGAVGSFGMVLMQFLLTVAVSAIMYRARRAGGVHAVIRFGIRLAGERGRNRSCSPAQAIRGVALGVVVTAFVQSAIGAFGLLVTGVPYAPVLSARDVHALHRPARPGAGAGAGGHLDVLRAAIAAPRPCCWSSAWSRSGSDNVLRPILIRRGVDLPMLLILVGVVGGLIAFGLIGLFLGPTVLAVGYTLLDAWIAEEQSPEAS